MEGHFRAGHCYPLLLLSDGRRMDITKTDIKDRAKSLNMVLFQLLRWDVIVAADFYRVNNQRWMTVFIVKRHYLYRPAIILL